MSKANKVDGVIMCDNGLKEFKAELSDLLARHGIALVCRNGNEDKDWSLELGFQNMRNGFTNEWLGRFHITSHDLNT